MNARARIPIIHARDRIVTHGQKRVTALCFKRVGTDRTVYLPSGHPFTCLGCAAVAFEKYGPCDLIESVISIVEGTK